MTADEAARVLGVTVEEVREHQAKGELPDPIPDDYLDPVVNFRIQLELAHQRKMLQRGADVAPD